MNMDSVQGRPTMSALAVAGSAVRQALASQAAWFIDPINGRDSRNGKTLATAIQTRNEFARRMFGVSLTQSIDVTITSSLLSTDNNIPVIYGNVSKGWSVNYIGTPTVLFTGAVTGYVARVGSTATTTKMTIAGLPVSWTASGLVGMIVEKMDASVRAVVVKDLGAKQAWLSPPLTSGNVQGAVFAVADVINVYSLPDFGTPVCFGGFNTYKYLSTTTRWQPYWGRNDFTSCSGGVLGNTVDGSYQLINHANGTPANGGLRTNVSGRALILGGWNDVIAVAGNITFGAHATLTALAGCEDGVIIATGGQNNVVADIEFNQTAALPAACIDMSNPQGGRAIFGGYVYGIATSTSLVRCQQRDQTVTFTRQPAVTTAVNAFFSLANVTELVSRLATTELTDYYGNRILGPAGPQLELDRYQVGLIARGVVAETQPILVQSSSSILIAGTAYFIGLGLRAGDVITSISLDVAVVGTLMTVSLIGLYDKAGNRLAVSADQGASWQTLGIRTAALGAPFTIPTTDMYYIGIFAAGTVLPTIVRGNATIPQHVFGAGTVSYVYRQTGQITLPSPATFVVDATVGAAPAFWFELT